MSQKFLALISTWPKPYIRDQDLAIAFPMEPGRRYDTVKYALRKGILITIKRGLYLIKLPFHKPSYEPLEIAQAIQAPSYISLESALSYHAWIPERVNIYTSVTAKRSKEFITPIGIFSYIHTPLSSFMLYVSRMETSTDVFLIADPWKAIADHIYVHGRMWNSLASMMLDMRIEQDSLLEANIGSLADLAQNYASAKVRLVLTKFYTEIINEHTNN